MSANSSEGSTAPQDEACPAASNFRIDAISAADIVLVYDQSPRLRNILVRFVNVVGQRVLASLRKTERLNRIPWRCKFSHVMLGLDGGLIIHADGKTVAVEVISDALHYQTKDVSIFRVYRRKDMSKDFADKIAQSAMRYYNQEYSFVTFFRKDVEEDTTQFCSRLVAHAYRSAGLPLTQLLDNKVLPVDLYQICQSDIWEDITEEFIQRLPSSAIDKSAPSIELPGQGKVSLSQWLRDTDRLILELARRRKQTLEEKYKNIQTLLQIEALLGGFCVIQFQLSKQISLDPSTLEDGSAARIASVL
jgi:hypothetical protein